jgi:transcriptional regulator with PAS, ATPase and Fis domain
MKNKLSNMLCLDLYLASLSKEKYKAIEPELISSESKKFPLLSFGLYVDSFSTEMNNLTRENDINTVKEFGSKYNWNESLDHIFKNEDFEAIVLTNKEQEIIWVNDGFKEMTGFNKNFALNKRPSFLQGSKTCEETTAIIRNKIKLNKPFAGTVINYKKNKMPYKCEIKIFPLFSKNTTHYIALEKAV